MGSHNRRRSKSSSSSSSSSSSEDEDKKHRKNKHEDAHPTFPSYAAGRSTEGYLGLPPPYSIPQGAPGVGSISGIHEPTRDMPPMPPMPLMPQIPGQHGDTFPGSHIPSSPPPAHTPPASGYRVPLSTTMPFPPVQQTGPPVSIDADGRSPIFIGSAIFPSSVHPCKIVPTLNPPCRVPYGGGEYEHHGRYDLLPFDPNTMEFVPTSHGQIPPGRRPIDGGYEESGGKLYHAVATVQGVKVPGKAGPHLGGCNVAFGGQEHQVTSGYDILCWR
ncbi:hypothetical protein A0H81_07587 [Grifola frondosa]|uniref:Uncharacterized protein n=1 Tax=Grifola frondosa TaxID=5627 RepID=A0A1C7M7T4_GRIFR|nr:hypothetical protein A0H81_07587 [Grifola frondosa]